MVNEQMDLERRQFLMGHRQSASCRVSKPPFGPCRYRRTFFVSFNAKEQSQGIYSLLYAWVAETLQSFLPQLANMGILFGELVGIETLESRLREAVVAARSQRLRHPDKSVHGPGPDQSRNRRTVSKEKIEL